MSLNAILISWIYTLYSSHFISWLFLKLFSRTGFIGLVVGNRCSILFHQINKMKSWSKLICDPIKVSTNLRIIKNKIISQHNILAVEGNNSPCYLVLIIGYKNNKLGRAELTQAEAVSLILFPFDFSH